MHRYTEEFARHGIVAGQVLLTVDDVTRRSHYRNAHRTFAKLLELGVLPIVNENDTVATTEIRFGDNDRLAALVAHLVHADLLVLLSDVDGAVRRPPARAGAAGCVAEVRARGRPGRRATSAARARRRRHRRHADQARGRPDRHRRRHPGRCSPPPTQAAEALAGEPVGTVFHPTGRRRPTRLLWLAHATEPQGPARRSTRGRCGRSPSAAPRCCPPGSPAVERHVRRRATRSTWSTRTARSVARGLVNYDADELPALLGRSTRDLARELGAAYEREVVHRDDLVLLRKRR